MLNTCKVRMSLLVLAAAVAMLIGTFNVRVWAQGTTGTILGVVTDSSGSVVPDANVQVTNTGTGANTRAVSDAQGRYNVPSLPVGDYQVSSQKAGFQAVVRTGVTLNAGANVVVDFALPVGQVSQTVTVEAEVTQVETTSAALGTVVEPVQMRDLPLNGRNFEELILLAPGVVNNQSPNLNGLTSLGSLTGKSNFWSVSGSRSNGQGELLDGTNIQNYNDRGSGSGILGTTLGVDAIAQFQLLTNTYGAQYGGNGAMVNAVTRSGSNDFHGSGYEFIRNSAVDAQNFADSTKALYQRNQFGATLGGPIKKDKMFIFGNYEGLRQNLGQAKIVTVPDSFTLQGLLPRSATGTPRTSCPTSAGFINPAFPTIEYFDCTKLATFAAQKKYLDLYKPISAMVTGAKSTQTSDGVLGPTGGILGSMSAPNPGNENYFVTRYDWNISDNDSLFARYLFDSAHTIEPLVTTPLYPQLDYSRNQYMTIGEKHIFSNSIINSFNLGYTRSYLDLHSEGSPTDPLAWNGNSLFGNAFGDKSATLGTLSPGGGLVLLGPGQNAPELYGQNKFGPSDDVFWTKGAHSVRFGGSAYRVQGNTLHGTRSGGAWTFSNLPSFFQNVPKSYAGVCIYTYGEPGCVSAAGTPLPLASATHNSRETQFAMYVQDDWKVTPTLTLNLGLRYSPQSNPWDATNQIYLLIPTPYGQTGEGYGVPSAALPGAPVPSAFSPAKNFMLKNPSLHNFDPRIGVAWDPFKDHKTSIRAGYGIFHTVIQARDYTYGAFKAFPNIDITQTSGLFFPTPAQTPITGSSSINYGMSVYPNTPYLQQWNLSVQREIMPSTVVTVAYVGSRGVHLGAQSDSNPPVPTGGLTPVGTGNFCGLAVAARCGGISVPKGQSLWASFDGQTKDLQFITGTGTKNANGSMTCVTPNGTQTQCTIGNPSGAQVVDPATGKIAGSHIVQTAATAFTAVVNNHLNPYFSFQNQMQYVTNSYYNALQASLIRRLSKGISLQVSYTYSSCFDVSSGSNGAEGGTNNSDPYNMKTDLGPCNFMIRHNLSTNGLYALPFKGNLLVEGWQIGGIFYISTGAALPVAGTGAGFDIGGGDSRANYSPNNGTCNNKPTELRNTPTGYYYFNLDCFTTPPVGETGNVGRNAFFQPKVATMNANLQKNTKISERLDMQLKFEVFNLFNRQNFTFAGQGAVSLTSAGTTSAALVGSNLTTDSNFGLFNRVIGYPINGSARQLQLGVKLIF